MQGMGMRGYDGVNVKQDPDDLLRLRGGAVSRPVLQRLISNLTIAAGRRCQAVYQARTKRGGAVARR